MARNEEIAKIVRDLTSSGSGRIYYPTVPAATPTSQSGMASFILSKATADFSKYQPSEAAAVAKTETKKHGEGIVARIFDILSRPGYAANEAMKRSGVPFNPQSFLNTLIAGVGSGNAEQALGKIAESTEGAISGLTGKSKTVASREMKQNEGLPDWMKKGKTGFAAGLTADILTDPLTYIPGVAVANLFGKGGKAAKVASTFDGPIDDIIKAPSYNPGSTAAGAVSSKLPALTGAKGTVKSTIDSLGSTKPVITLPGIGGNFSRQVTKAEDLISNIAKAGINEAPEAIARIAPKTSPIGEEILTSSMRQIAETTAERLAKSTRKTSFNPNLQVQLLKKISKQATDPVYAKAMLKAAEDHLESLGKLPESWDGIGLRLSDVIDDVGRAIDPSEFHQLAKPGGNIADDLAQSIENVKARKAMGDADVVKIAADQTASTMAAADNLSQTGQRVIAEGVESQVAQVLKGAQASTATHRATRDLIKDIVRAQEPPIQHAIRRHKDTWRRIADGQPAPISAARAAVNDAMRANGVEVGKASIGKRMTEARVVNEILSRVSAAHGERAIHPMVNVAQRSARAVARTRANAISNMFKGLDNTAKENIVKAIQGAVPPEMLDDVTQTALTAFEDSMHSLFRSSGVGRIAKDAESVADRIGMVGDDLNRMLKTYGLPRFKFKADQLGNWQQSWKAQPWKAETIERDLFTLQSAVEQLTHEYALMDSLASTFGSGLRKPGMVKVKHARLGDTYFPKEIAGEVEHALKTMHDFYNPNSKFLRGLREATNVWKTLVTIPNPSHHILNFSGDFFLSFMDGLTDMRYYKWAAHVQRTMPLRFKGPAVLDEFVGEGAILNAKRAAKGKVLFTHKGTKVTDEMIYVAAMKKGVIQDVHAIEDISGEGIQLSQKLTRGPKANPLRLGSAVSQANGNYTRMAHFMYGVRKSNKPFEEAIEEAAERVAKWHPDSMDLTKWEQRTKLLIPFYSWTRKSMPIILEGALMRPSRALLYNKTVHNIQQVRGEETSQTDPFNTGGLWPGWMVQPGTVGAVFAPRDPLHDLLNQGANPRTLLGMATPFAKIPYEMMMEQRLDSGAKIYDKNKYLLQQAPIAAKGRSIATAEDKGTAITNWLTGANIVKPESPDDPWVIAREKDKQSKTNKEIREWARDAGLKNSKGEPISNRGTLPQYIKDAFNQAHSGKD